MKNEYEDTLYKIMSVLNDSKLPLLFKGALVLFQAKSCDILFRGTGDIDCDWIESAPSGKEIEQKLNDAIKCKLPNIKFELYRDYIIGKQSAGLNIFENDILLTKMDISIKPASSAKMYYVGEYSFYGYDLLNIVSDKVSVLSSKKIARRIKDLLDIYTIVIGDNLSKKQILNELKIKNRKLENFSFFINNKEDVKHAYDKFKTMFSKPDFDKVYDVVFVFVQGFFNENEDLKWDFKKLMWI